MPTVTRDPLIDQAGPVRPGESLDLDRLRRHLEPVLGPAAAKLTAAQFPGGHSNLTYLLSAGGDSWVLRRPPFGSKVRTAHDMSREYRVLSALGPVYPYGPRPVHFCGDRSVLGCDFYLMSPVRGLVIRREYPARLKLSPERTRRQMLNFLDALIELHRIDPKDAGLEDFGRPEGYVRRQVEGWSRRWADAVTPDAPDLDAVMAWLAERMPAESPRAAVIHNDYKLDNVVFDPADPLRVVGVLDWEMATVGDPLMDLGCVLSYWAEQGDPDFFRAARSGPTDVDGAPTRAELVERFERRTGLSVGDLAFYHCFGLFRLAVIGQQIYYRYRRGLTRDRRFAGFLGKAFALKRMCERIIAERAA